MLERTKETLEKDDGLKDKLAAAGEIAAVALNVELLKKKVDNAVEEAVYDAQRMAKKGRHAIEDVIDDAAYRIRKEPLRSAGYVFSAGLGLGVLSGWFLTRRLSSGDH
jgi:ElaB/YqjD/DUF883 family membrane-anchored ribosome-binding protein